MLWFYLCSYGVKDMLVGFGVRLKLLARVLRVTNFFKSTIFVAVLSHEFIVHTHSRSSVCLHSFPKQISVAQSMYICIESIAVESVATQTLMSFSLTVKMKLNNLREHLSYAPTKTSGATGLSL